MRVRVCVLLVLVGCVLVGTTSRRSKPRPLQPGISRCNSMADESSPSEIEKQIKDAEFVFTGKVMEEYDPPPALLHGGRSGRKQPEYRGFWVRVKRVLRGGGHLRGEVQMLVSKTAEGEADGDRYMSGCVSVVRVHHTAIFLARRWNQEGNTNGLVTIVTTADPIPITLTNLDQVNAIVKDFQELKHDVLDLRPQTIPPITFSNYIPYESLLQPQLFAKDPLLVHNRMLHQV